MSDFQLSKEGERESSFEDPSTILSTNSALGLDSIAKLPSYLVPWALDDGIIRQYKQVHFNFLLYFPDCSNDQDRGLDKHYITLTQFSANFHLLFLSRIPETEM